MPKLVTCVCDDTLQLFHVSSLPVCFLPVGVRTFRVSESDDLHARGDDRLHGQSRAEQMRVCAHEWQSPDLFELSLKKVCCAAHRTSNHSPPGECCTSHSPSCCVTLCAFTTLLTQSPRGSQLVGVYTGTQLVSLWDKLPDEIALARFLWVAMCDSKATLTVVPTVCRRWRALCGDTRGVRLDFLFLPARARLRREEAAGDATVVASLVGIATLFRHIVEWNLISGASPGFPVCLFVWFQVPAVTCSLIAALN